MLFSHSLNNGKEKVLTILKVLLDLFSEYTFGKLDIILGGSVLGHKGDEAILRNIDKLVILTDDIGNAHVVGRGGDFFVLLTSEDIDTDEIDLGAAVLTSLRGAHVDDLAGTVVHKDETILAKSRTLDGEGVGGSRGNLVESFIFLVRHDSIVQSRRKQGCEMQNLITRKTWVYPFFLYTAL